MSDSIVRESIDLRLGGKAYRFDRPVISKRREFFEDAMAVFEVLETLEMDAEGEAKQSAKNMVVMTKAAKRILTFLPKYSAAVRADAKYINEQWNAARLGVDELIVEFTKLREFVEAPFGVSREDENPADTSVSG